MSIYSCIICAYLCICIYTMGFLKATPLALSYLEIYYAFILFIAALVGGINIFQRRSELRLMTPSLFLVIIVGAATRLYSFNDFSIWLDEYTQFAVSNESNPLITAIHQQQMPIDYMLSVFSRRIFGFQEFAPRLPALIAGILSCGVFFFLCQRIILNFKFVALATALFLITPRMVEFSSVGRPIALTVLAGLMYFHVVWDEYNKKQLASWKGSALLFLTSFFLLNVTFFQNFIFLFSVNLALLLIFKPSPKHLFQIVITQLLAVLISLPVTWKLIAVSISTKANSLTLENLFSPNGKPYQFLDIVNSCVENSKYFLLILFPFFIIAFYKNIVNKDNIFKSQCALLSVVATFITVFSISYFVFVKWPINSRYSLILFPIVILAIVYTVKNLRTMVPKKFSFLATAFLIILLIGQNVRSLYSYYTSSQAIGGHGDWRGVYRTINQYGKPGDLIIGSRYDNYDVWRPAGIMAYEFYLHEHFNYHLPQMKHTESMATYLRSLLIKDIHPSAVFFIHIWNEGYTSKNLPEKTFFMGFKQMGLLAKQVDDQWKDTLLDLIRTSIKLKQGKNIHLTLLQLEMEILLHQKNLKDAQIVFHHLLEYQIKERDPELFHYYQKQLANL